MRLCLIWSRALMSGRHARIETVSGDHALHLELQSRAEIASLYSAWCFKILMQIKACGPLKGALGYQGGTTCVMQIDAP